MTGLQEIQDVYDRNLFLQAYRSLSEIDPEV